MGSSTASSEDLLDGRSWGLKGKVETGSRRGQEKEREKEGQQQLNFPLPITAFSKALHLFTRANEV